MHTINAYHIISFPQIIILYFLQIVGIILICVICDVDINRFQSSGSVDRANSLDETFASRDVEYSRARNDYR